MDTKSCLTVLFEDPFWIGLYERTADGKYEVCKITFGAEPKDYEIHAFLLANWYELKFSPAVEAERIKERKSNPKRVQREIAGEMGRSGIGTKAQQALKLQQEERKLIRKEKSREQRDAEKRRQFQLRQEKKKEKRRGR